MQKPQQRKYHSSCNRSVHRGTAHGRQRVKICKRKTPHLLVRSFLSPYGDKLQSIAKLASAIARFGLSPPYGDGTKISIQTATIVQFSPPTGMVPKRLIWEALLARLRPLTGMVLKDERKAYVERGSRPLTGMVPTATQMPPCFSGFRSLTGMVPNTQQHGGTRLWFSPPYGDGTKKPMVRKVWSQFSPPYGDGTIQAKPNVPHC